MLVIAPGFCSPLDSSKTSGWCGFYDVAVRQVEHDSRVTKLVTENYGEENQISGAHLIHFYTFCELFMVSENCINFFLVKNCFNIYLILFQHMCGHLYNLIESYLFLLLNSLTGYAVFCSSLKNTGRSRA